MSYVQHTHSGHINETKFHLFFCGWFGWNKRRLHKQYQMGKRIRLSLNTNRILVLRRVYSNTILLRLLRLQFNTINNSTSYHVLSDAHPSPVLPHCLVTTLLSVNQVQGTWYQVPSTGMCLYRGVITFFVVPARLSSCWRNQIINSLQGRGGISCEVGCTCVSYVRPWYISYVLWLYHTHAHTLDHACGRIFGLYWNVIYSILSEGKLNCIAILIIYMAHTFLL